MRRRVKLENLLLDESLRLLQLADLHLQDTGNKEYDSMCWSQANMPSYLRAPPHKPLCVLGGVTWRERLHKVDAIPTVLCGAMVGAPSGGRC